MGEGIKDVYFGLLEHLMDTEAAENSQNALPNSNVVDQNHDNSVPEISNHRALELQHEIPAEEVRGILEAIAATGKFWYGFAHDWHKLKCMLSFRLNQVLAEYPEAKMTNEEQISSLGETFMELVKRLDDGISTVMYLAVSFVWL
ncbi:hypothetical protein M9H77_26222 [Catharanthus roseus]|uniref:Uncharacterized protein n=1 Tax=Catharanthus roseus TaxID=4058 RepID=A0ACC0A9D4_CATRO|nr:hypothetical protein M9H77_26222 [Catharanthus roseus]